MSGYFSIKNWRKFQHYKDRTPPWIKLHRELLDDYEFSCLQDASKAHLVLLWLLSSQLNNRIPSDPAWLKNRLGLKTNIDLQYLEEKGFIIIEKDVGQDASTALAKRSLEKETDNIKKNIKKKKISLAEWEQKNGELTSSMLEAFALKHKQSPEQMARLVGRFRSKCAASDYRYVDFRRAFESWDWKLDDSAEQETKRFNRNPGA